MFHLSRPFVFTRIACGHQKLLGRAETDPALLNAGQSLFLVTVKEYYYKNYVFSAGMEAEDVEISGETFR